MRRLEPYVIIFFALMVAEAGGYTSILLAQTTEAAVTKTTQLHSLLEKAQQESNSTQGWLIALKYYGEAYRLAQEQGYLAEQAQALQGIAKIESSFGNRNQEALQYMFQELEIRALLDVPLETAQSYILVGEMIENKLFTPQNASGYYQQALYLQEKFNERPQERLKTVNKILGVFRYLQQTDSLVYYQVKKLQLLKILEAPRTELAQISLSISENYLALEHFEEARSFALDAQQYAPEANAQISLYLTELEKRQKTMQNRSIQYEKFIWWGLITFAVLMCLVVVRQKITHLQRASAAD